MSEPLPSAPSEPSAESLRADYADLTHLEYGEDRSLAVTRDLQSEAGGGTREWMTVTMRGATAEEAAASEAAKSGLVLVAEHMEQAGQPNPAVVGAGKLLVTESAPGVYGVQPFDEGGSRLDAEAVVGQAKRGLDFFNGYRALPAAEQRRHALSGIRDPRRYDLDLDPTAKDETLAHYSDVLGRL